MYLEWTASVLAGSKKSGEIFSPRIFRLYSLELKNPTYSAQEYTIRRAHEAALGSAARQDRASSTCGTI
jgi:hypothetical protein